MSGTHHDDAGGHDDAQAFTQLRRILHKLLAAGLLPAVSLGADRRFRSGVTRVARLGPDELGRRIEAIYDTHFEQLVRYAQRDLGNRQDAEDAVQNAFVRVIKADPDLDDTDALPGYLRIAVRNEAYRLGSKNTRDREHRGADVVDLESRREAPDKPVDESVCDQVAVGLLIATLPPRQWACIWLFYFEDLSVQEIAERLDISEGTVKGYLHDARGRLHRLCPSLAA
jgi:RNA polymerase sigma factor (sigma-70 family)